MQVSEVMHKGVVSVDINDTIKKVAALMKEEDIGSVPVFEEGKPVGFVTDRDIVISCVAEGQSLDQPISHAMSEDLIYVHQDDDVEKASKMMRQNQISRVLVMDGNERPVGMVSLHDLVKEGEEKISSKTVSSIKQ